MEHSALITVMSSAVRKVSRRILRDFHELRFLQSSRKPLDKFLNRTIFGAEKVIFEILNKARPEFGVISRYCDYESKDDKSSYWVINVLEGIENFARAIPYFSISISVKEKNNITGDEEITAGVIFLPALGEFYFAEEGKGSWYEFSGEFQAGFPKSRLKLSEKSKVKPIVFTNDLQFNNIKSSARILGSHSASLAYLASARGDKCVLNYDNFCDVAAGIIIAKEAGSVVKNDTEAKRLIAERL